MCIVSKHLEKVLSVLKNDMKFLLLVQKWLQKKFSAKKNDCKKSLVQKKL